MCFRSATLSNPGSLKTVASTHFSRESRSGRQSGREASILKVRWCVTPGGRSPTEVTHQRRRAPARGRAVWRSWSAPNPTTRAVSLIHLVPSSYIVSLQNCMNEEYWRLAGPDLPVSIRGGGNRHMTWHTMPTERMGPPPGALPPAHDCIMVRIQTDLPHTSVRREDAPNGELPSDRHADRRRQTPEFEERSPSRCSSSLRVLRPQGAAKHKRR
jgi:hypothetical protein